MEKNEEIYIEKLETENKQLIQTIDSLKSNFNIIIFNYYEHFISILLNLLAKLCNSDKFIFLWEDNKSGELKMQSNEISKNKKDFVFKHKEELLELRNLKILSSKELEPWKENNPKINSVLLYPIKKIKRRGIMIGIKNKFDSFSSKDILTTDILSNIIQYIAFGDDSLFNVNIDNFYHQTILSLSKAIDIKDFYTADHSKRVSKYAINIGKILKLTKDEINHLKYGGLLHDIGKIGINECILNKKSKLNRGEFEIMKKHPKMGANVLKDLDCFKDFYNIIKFHHERIDGNGYPYKLKKEEIPFTAKIICVADAWDAMTSDRVYRKAISFEKAKRELLENAGSQFDINIIRSLEKEQFNFKNIN